jgi:hypothetical protein
MFMAPEGDNARHFPFCTHRKHSRRQPIAGMDVTDPWTGWRIAGRYLIDPAGQRITPERLRGLLWRDEMELRLAGYASRRRAEAATRSPQYGPKIKVVVIDLGEYRVRGTVAG